MAKDKDEETVTTTTTTTETPHVASPGEEESVAATEAAEKDDAKKD